jgi:shikimate 5-dehydrogenase
MADAKPATMVFIGVSTGGSFINRLFPVWAELLGLSGARLAGIDLPPGVAAGPLRAAVAAIAGDPAVAGALVTTHKIAVAEHARDLFAGLDGWARRLGEVGVIVKTARGLEGGALDPVTAPLALDRIEPPSHWTAHPQAEGLLMGCGGASVALAAGLLERPPGLRPARLILTDVDPTRVAAARRHLPDMAAVEVLEVAGPADHDRLAARLPPGSLLANGTGLGKDRPGSPVTAACRFPGEGIAWDFNYRGALDFLAHARSAAIRSPLTPADGWHYFLYGWSHAIASVFGAFMDAEMLAKLEAAAEEMRSA